jgi:hypothetical protein
LNVVQTARDFFAVTRNERDGGTAIQQLNRSADLLRADFDFSGQLAHDFLHVLSVYLGKACKFAIPQMYLRLKTKNVAISKI